MHLLLPLVFLLPMHLFCTRWKSNTSSENSRFSSWSSIAFTMELISDFSVELPMPVFSSDKHNSLLRNYHSQNSQVIPKIAIPIQVIHLKSPEFYCTLTKTVMPKNQLKCTKIQNSHIALIIWAKLAISQIDHLFHSQLLLIRIPYVLHLYHWFHFE